MTDDEETLLPEPEQEIQFNTHSPKIRKLIAQEQAQRGRTWSYYENMKKDDPKKYWNAKTQAQMHNDAIALQDNFIDGDFLNE
jgi:hypothetical protein